MNIQFRSARLSDLDQIFHIFESAIQNMISQNILQWDEIYPQKEDLREDILKKELYIGIIDHEIACAYVINDECDEQYKNGSWEFPDASYKVVHRLCVEPRFQNRGVGRETVRHIEEAVREMGIESIRLDAFTQNPFSLRMYKKAGYKITGHADWRKGRFYLMEKRLTSMEVIHFFETDRQSYWLEKIKESGWEAGALLHKMISEGTFFENVGKDSKVLLLTDGDELVSFCTYAQKDDIQPTELTPWMGFVFTFPKYRGHRYMGLLFEEVERLAKEEHRSEVYISTDRIGLYEKYGCEYKTQMNTISGELSRIYVKKIDNAITGKMKRDKV